MGTILHSPRRLCAPTREVLLDLMKERLPAFLIRYSEEFGQDYCCRVNNNGSVYIVYHTTNNPSVEKQYALGTLGQHLEYYLNARAGMHLERAATRIAGFPVTRTMLGLASEVHKVQAVLFGNTAQQKSYVEEYV